LASAARQTPIFTPSYAPVKNQSDSSMVIGAVMVIGILVLVLGLTSIPRNYRITTSKSAPPNTILPMTNNDFVIEYAASVYNAFQTLLLNEQIKVLQGKKFDCLQNNFVQFYGLTWNTPPNAVKSCLVSLEKNNDVRVVVRGKNGFVSVNGK
ncbi:MAG: hypothetical protein RLZZ156_2285, partial [Deinococcota bacterium]